MTRPEQLQGSGREPMSAGERNLRDKLRKKWVEEHTVWGQDPRDYPWSDEEFGAAYTAYRTKLTDGPITFVAVYTTSRMFDGRFWAMRYRWVKVRRRYELERGSVRQRAKRKDAKAIAIDYLKGEQ